MNRAIFMLVPVLLANAANFDADSARGEHLFETLACIQCHSVNGTGGKVAPDLGSMVDRAFTPATLAATMWNHAPTMWVAMRGRGVRSGDLSEQGAADLFAYFYSARFFDELGDAGRGKRLFSSKHCADCHGLTEVKLPAAIPVSQWQVMSSPVALVTAMWNHAATMRQEFARRKLPWPELTSQECTDMLVYLRNLPALPHHPELLTLSSGENGRNLFSSKGCADCHTANLPMRLRRKTLTDIAVDMWNHAPKIAGAVPALDVSDFRNLISYLWAEQFFAGSGDPVAGKRVFAVKHCAACHEDASNAAPKLALGQNLFTGATMVSALWRHGPQMLDRMRSQDIAWPHFDGAEMSNLIAYLNEGGRSK